MHAYTEEEKKVATRIVVKFDDRNIFEVENEADLRYFNLGFVESVTVTSMLTRWEAQTKFGSGNYDEELKDLLRRGLKINAIKRRREVTGEGLKDAKEYVDALQRKIQMSPEF